MSPRIAMYASNMLRLGFTAREQQIAWMLMAGVPTKEIAERLYIEVVTVKGHITTIRRRIGMHDPNRYMTGIELRRVLAIDPNGRGICEEEAA